MNKIKKIIRKIFEIPETPSSLSWDGWKVWQKEQKINYPVRYFINYVLFTKIRVMKMRFDDMIFVIKSFLFMKHKYYLIDTKLPKYEHHENPEKMLHGMFALLCDYVEIECAHLHECNVLWGKDKEKIKQMKEMDLGFRGITHLQDLVDVMREDKQFTNEEQIKSSLETIDLYIWWTKTRPNRKDPYEFSKDDDFDDVLSESNKDKKSENYKKAYELDNEYDKEDTLMLKRLVDIRQSLWT